jgi:TetR/AcrR family transcriptional repressor of nem operon
MPRTADKTDIPKRLTEAGYLLFTQRGYNATGIQQIADQAGVPKGSFYNHFDSKEAFAAAIIGNYTAWVGQAWDTCMADAPAAPLAAIEHVFARFVQHHAETRCQGCLVGNFAAEVAESSTLCRDMLQASAHDWRERLGTLLRAAQDAGTVRTDVPADQLSAFFWDVWEGALLRMKIEHSIAPLQQTVRIVLGHLLRP